VVITKFIEQAQEIELDAVALEGKVLNFIRLKFTLSNLGSNIIFKNLDDGLHFN
jgi:hypothetical protein